MRQNIGHPIQNSTPATLEKEPYEAIDHQTEAANLTDQLNNSTKRTLKNDRPLRLYNSVRLRRPSTNDDTNDNEDNRNHRASPKIALSGITLPVVDLRPT